MCRLIYREAIWVLENRRVSGLPGWTARRSSH